MNLEEQQSNFDLIAKEVQDGIDGKNRGIPIGFRRLDKHIGIRKRIYTTIMGAPGSGKSALTHSAFILNPFDYYIQQGRQSGLKLKIILFAMERSRIYTIAKWVSRKIFLDTGVLIPVGKMLGWYNEKMTLDEHDLFIQHRDYVDAIDDVVDIIEGTQNPTGIYKTVKAYAEANGKVESIGKFNNIYIPDNENEVVIPITDHAALTKLEKGITTKKQAIDKLSEYYRGFRDLYGYSPIMVSQLNRDLSNPMYQKMDSFEPTLDSIKDSGAMGEDSDVVISLFDPLRYRTSDPNYEAQRFVNQETGAKCFRSIKVIKNTYGEDDLRVGVAFHGAIGEFRELPRPSMMDNFNYEEVFNGNYFLNK